MKSIAILGDSFLRRHDWLLDAAKSCEVAICGGVAAAICKERSDYVPADLDLVSTKANALRFLDQVNHFLLEREVHYRVYVNSRNVYVPAPATNHFRIQTPFWLPVCLFVLPHDGFRYYRIQGGHLLQWAEDVKAAADGLTQTDAKPRLANELDCFPELEIDLAAPDHDAPELNDFADDFNLSSVCFQTVRPSSFTGPNLP